ncbi:IS4 family transposase [Thiomonas sp.]
MNAGKTLFAQIMESVPWTSAARLVQRHGGDVGVRTLSCAEQFRASAFAQLTWRESLRDVNVLDIVPAEAGAFDVMDRGYVDFRRLSALHQAGAFFVTRAKKGRDARRVDSAPTDRSTGVLCDQRVMLSGDCPAKKYPERLRRIRFTDPASGKTLIFLTNNTSLPALTIAALYKSRWQVELFFQWIKQHLRIKRLLGTSEHAVKTPIWCAIAIVKKELHLDASLYACLQILSVSVFEKIQLSCALQPERNQSEPDDFSNQLNLFGI